MVNVVVPVAFCGRPMYPTLATVLAVVAAEAWAVILAAVTVPPTNMPPPTPTPPVTTNAPVVVDVDVVVLVITTC